MQSSGLTTRQITQVGAVTTDGLALTATITAVKASGVISSAVIVKSSSLDKLLMEAVMRGVYGFLGFRCMMLSSLSLKYLSSVLTMLENVKSFFLLGMHRSKATRLCNYSDNLAPSTKRSCL